jgi:hypothetical protein
MTFEEFEDQARLYVVGALDPGEIAAFDAARRGHGARAEACINDCRRLNTAFALTLRPHAPQHDAKEKLMSLIQKSLRERSGNV